MALFQKRPEVGSNQPLYSIGSNKNVLIVGLGNPDKKYEGTRHNVGFAIIDKLAKENDFPGWAAKKDLKCEVTIHNLGDTRVILCKPLTYMNLSGEAVSSLQRFFRIYNQNTLAVYDELAIKFGQLRTRLGGSDAGHNGVKSLMQYIGEDFSRLRIGVGNEVSEKADAADFVLGKFTKKEQESLPKVLREANSLITEYVFSGQLPHETRTIF